MCFGTHSHWCNMPEPSLVYSFKDRGRPSFTRLEHPPLNDCRGTRTLWPSSWIWQSVPPRSRRPGPTSARPRHCMTLALKHDATGHKCSTIKAGNSRALGEHPGAPFLHENDARSRRSASSRARRCLKPLDVCTMFGGESWLWE